MILYKQVSSGAELRQVLELQELNLKQHVSIAEKESEGFVTVKHSLELLGTMHEKEASIIATHKGRVIGYALVMTKECRNIVPELLPMFDLLDELSFKNNPLITYRYYVMGQVCIDKKYRGQGVFDGLYQHHRLFLQSRYDLVITEISTCNKRSVNAHLRVGFEIMNIHRDAIDEWAVVVWDWCP